MARAGGFSEETIRTLAERAHHHCSNPDCGVQTTMPLKGSRRTLRVGEAAHIYGLGRDVPRFRDDLSSKDLADITNGIWLCRSCHAKIDKSGDIYSAELLFKWKSEHEDCVRAGFNDRKNFRQMVTSDLDLKMPDASSRALQIARDLPYAWEYKLTTELIFEFARELDGRARDLSGGLYTRRGEFVHPDQYFRWFSRKMTEISDIIDSILRLIDEELPMSWGDPGDPGDKFRIYNSCIKIRNAFNRLIEIEEDVIFTYSDECFDRIRYNMRGFSLKNITNLFDMAAKMREVFELERPVGIFKFELKMDSHEGFSNMSELAQECMDEYLAKSVQA